MKHRLILAFLKDMRSFTIGYFFSNILIIVFYVLSVTDRVEVIYPFIICFFIYSIVMAVEWYKYYGFNKLIKNCADNQEFEINAITEEQKNIKNVIEDIHTTYLSKIDSMINGNETKQFMITQWIHNIKTPISVIDLILQKENNRITIDPVLLDDIKKENDKSIEQLERLLTIIRLDYFSKDYIIEPVNLTEQIRKLVNQRKNQFVYNRVFPKILTDDKEYMVLTDQKWNELMLEQVISNAIKYSSATNQNKYVYFSICQEGKCTTLSIRDEGLGISAYDQKRIFEPFTTGDNGRILHNATGIGLYFCRMIAEKLDVRIGIESKKGEGTNFTFRYLTKL